MPPPATIPNCPFCKIVRYEAEAYRLYEDDLVLAFLDIGPINSGHALVIPKTHHNSLTTVPDEVLARMMVLAPKLAQAIVREVEADSFNLWLANSEVAGQIVNHTHLHIVPRTTTDGFAWGWRSGELTDTDACTQLAAAVSKRLEEPVNAG